MREKLTLYSLVLWVVFKRMTLLWDPDLTIVPIIRDGFWSIHSLDIIADCVPMKTFYRVTGPSMYLASYRSAKHTGTSYPHSLGSRVVCNWAALGNTTCTSIHTHYHTHFWTWVNICLVERGIGNYGCSDKRGCTRTLLFVHVRAML